MNTPFRKLIRIAVILIALVIIFNFLGYYLVRSKSQANEQMASSVNFTTRQKMLAQTIVKEAAILLKNGEYGQAYENTRNNLKNDLIELNNNNRFLRGELIYPYSERITNSFEITNILTKAQTNVKSILATGNEVANADSMLLAMNSTLYLRQLNYNAGKLTQLLE